MTRLIQAEALRLRTARTYWLLATAAIALIAGAVAATAAATSFTGGVSPARQVLAIAGLAQTAALLAGVLSVTGEFRHKTITPAVLITPRRTPLLAAKLITLAAAGLAFGLAATGMATAIALPLLAARHLPAGVSGTGAAAIIAGGGIATALAAAFGIGVGAIIRNQAPSSPSSPCSMWPSRCSGSSRTSAPPSSSTASAAWPPPPPAPPTFRAAPTSSGRQQRRSCWPATPPRPCSPAPRCCAAVTFPRDRDSPARPTARPGRMIARPGPHSRPSARPRPERRDIHHPPCTELGITSRPFPAPSAS